MDDDHTDDPGLVGLADQIDAEARDADPVRRRALAALQEHLVCVGVDTWILLLPSGPVVIGAADVLALVDAVADSLRGADGTGPWPG